MKKKILIVLMTCIILLCACGRVKTNNSKTPDTVPETASYYEGHKIVLADEYKDEKKYPYSYISPKCYLDEYIAVYVKAEKASSNAGSTEEYVCIYDYNGELRQQTDLNDLESGRVYSNCCIGKSKIGMNAICIFRGGGAACPAWREPRVRTRRSHPFGTNVIQRLLSHRPLASTCRVLHQWP